MTGGAGTRRSAVAAAVLLAALATAVLFGPLRWRLRTRDLRARLDAPDRTGSAAFDPRELEALPLPVRRYFERALRPGQPVVLVARVKTEGEFQTDAAKGSWTPFTADKVYVAHPPAFDWVARLRSAPRLFVFVHDAYRAGSGLLRAELLGLVPVASQEDTPDVARGELLRFLAESCWFPTALLPGRGVAWEALDEERARATLTDRGTSVSLEFRFGPDGLVASVFAPERPRTVGGRNVATPWEGTWTAFGPRNGMRVPSAGEVAWVLPDGRLPYWRGRVTSVAYEFADPAASRPR